ncbi:alpha/beta hydrolase [Rhizobium sp. Root1220]|uniref:alpha/beta fold hydrolase n=1 Tax=Rhizobium sp. Root1220 TaxID=1736432 RepID=UPI0006FF6C12|nr:alpha/beta hydrolase [Rhizobium sp. Root1220]KQV81332.1 hypothetical protein ASC90_03135 [Rhizobium sp. Root1220]
MEQTLETTVGTIRLSDTGGSGTPLVLLHGSGSSRRVFARQLDSVLAQRARMIALDLPGHGDSDNAPDPLSAYTLPGLASCVEDVLRQLAIDKAALFGWSLGGHVAIEMLARGRAVSGLMLTGTPPVPRGLIGMLRGFLPSFDLFLASKPVFSPRDVDRFVKLCFGASAVSEFHRAVERTDGRLRTVFSQSMLRGEGSDQRQVVANALVPIHFVNGADDPFVRLSYIAGFQKNDDPRTTVETISGAGHAPFWEQPQTFNTAIGRFLDAVEGHRINGDRRRTAVF